MRSLVLAAIVGLATALLSLATVQAQDRQAIYDGAQQAYDKQDWAAAAEGFMHLLPTDQSKPLLRSEAVISIRYAAAELRLGRKEEASAWIDRALAAPKLDVDSQAEAWLTKGDIERVRYDLHAALAAYERADTLAAPGGMSNLVINARFGEAYAGATIDPPHVLERITTLLADPAFRKMANRAMIAQAEDEAARAAINGGDKEAARRWISKAVDDSGGLTTEVSYAAAAIRADAGLVSMLRGDDDGAHKYFAYTGAGHLPDMAWLNNHSGALPTCGEQGDEIAPTDSVVVTLFIGDDGNVANVTPTYASRPGTLGETFARAVGTWRWNPDGVKKLTPFWRATVQFELRCVSRPRPEQLDSSLWKETLDWLRARNLVTNADLAPGGEQLLQTRLEDPRRQTSGGAVFNMAANRIPQTEAAASVVWSRFQQAGAPPVAYALLIERMAQRQGGGGLKDGARRQALFYDTWIARFRTQFPNDPALPVLMLDAAIARETAGDFAGARPLLQWVVTSGLAEDDPVRRVALLHQAIDLDHAGDHISAKALLLQSRLTSEQCSMFDTHPIAKYKSASSLDFPAEAMRWGFEGYVQEDYDIGADGRVKNARAVMAYPPYIFEHATNQIVDGFLYEPPRLGGEVLGCEGQRQSINFRMAK